MYQMRGLWALSAVSLLLVLSTSLGMPYSPQRPQRLMLFHTRVTEHGRAADTDHLYWLPATDANTYTYLQKYSRLRGEYHTHILFFNYLGIHTLL